MTEGMESAGIGIRRNNLTEIILGADILPDQCLFRADGNCTCLVHNINTAAGSRPVMVKQCSEFAHGNIDSKQADIRQLGMPDSKETFGEFDRIPRIQRAESRYRKIRFGRDGQIPRLQRNLIDIKDATGEIILGIFRPVQHVEHRDKAAACGSVRREVLQDFVQGSQFVNDPGAVGRAVRGDQVCKFAA
ncbi:hypothetical protein D3C73_916110 [compost metagenome]